MTVHSPHENGILVSGDERISLAKIFDCGQCFRFERVREDFFSGVVTGSSGGKRLNVRQISPTSILIEGISEEEYLSKWKSFFGFDLDYNRINADILNRFGQDETIRKATAAADGIRILRQDKWETLISFIISQNNNIPRIKGIIERLSRECGGKIDNNTYSFPTPAALCEAGVDGLAEMKTGFRAKYIFGAASGVSSGEINLDRLAGLSCADAEEELMKIKGVGKKVASCVLLFGYGFLSAFPVDVWIKRTLDRYYPDGLDISSLGEYAGIAQQYLFYYTRYS